MCLVRGGLPPGGGWVSWHALRQTPLPPVDRQTLVKILPWPNFVAAGNNMELVASQYMNTNLDIYVKGLLN